MDTEKLLRVLNDVRSDEKGLGITAKLDEIRNLLSQNNPNSFGGARGKLNELLSLVEKSVAFDFRPTESSLLGAVGGSPYFGQGLAEKLKEVMGAQSFEQMGRVDEYRSARNSFNTKIERLIANLNELGIEEYRPGEWEVGITLPEDAVDADRLTDVLGKLRHLFSALATASGETPAPIKITRASNGTIELFSLQSVEVAVLFTTLLCNASEIWEKIGRLKGDKKAVDDAKHYDKETKDGMHVLLDNQIKKLRNEITDEIPEKVMKAAKVKKFDNGIDKEIRNQIRASLKVILGWLQVGIELEVTPIRVKDAAAEKPTDKKEAEMLATAAKTNLTLREIYKLPLEVRALPPGILTPDDKTAGEEAPQDEKKEPRPE